MKKPYSNFLLFFLMRLSKEIKKSKNDHFIGPTRCNWYRKVVLHVTIGAPLLIELVYGQKKIKTNKIYIIV